MYAKKKHGFYVSKFLWGFRQSVLHAVRTAEQEYERAPYIVEVAQIHKRDSKMPTIALICITLACHDLYRNDELLGDKELHRVSVNPTN